MPDINSGSKYKPTKSGPVRQAGQLPSGDASTGRGATARAGTLASSKGDGGDGGSNWKASFAEGTKQRFRPTVSKGGKGKIK